MFGIFKKKKKAIIETPIEVHEEEITQDDFHYWMENDMEVRYPLYVGSRIICVSNRINSVMKGTIVAFDTITQEKCIVPIVQFDGDENHYTCLGTLIPYTKKMYNKLMKLDKRNDYSAWNFVAPSWCQIKDKGEVFKLTKDSVRKEVNSL